MTTKQVTVFNGDDASPEVMVPAVDILKSMDLDIEFSYPADWHSGEWRPAGRFFQADAKAAIDHADATFFGSTSGDSTAALFYLRWGKQTFANVRPCKWLPGFNSPLCQSCRVLILPLFERILRTSI